MVNADLFFSGEFHELKTAALKVDYREIIDHLPVGRVVGPDQRSFFRSEETAKVYKQMEDKGVVIVSGCKGIGKSSLLRQLQGYGKKDVGKAFYLDVGILPGGEKDNIKRGLISEAEDQGLEAKGIEGIIEFLKEKEGILLLDELTGIFREEGVSEEFSPLVSLINLAEKENVPTALVVHYIPEQLQRARETFPFLTEAPLKIPRLVSTDEIEKVMLSGAVYGAKQSPYRAQVLRVESKAVESVERLVGSKPILLNQFIQDLYLDQLRGISPSLEITSSVIEEYWARNVGRIVRDRPALNRVLDIAKYYYFEDKKKRDTFQATFNLPSFTNFQSVAEKLRSIKVSQVDHQTLADWLGMGLVKEINGVVSVDGLLTAMAISHKFLL